MSEGFHLSAYTATGEHVGDGFVATASLSAKWLETCAQFLDANGPVVDAHWSGSLSRYRTTLTSARRSGVLTLYAGEIISTSALLLGGDDPDADDDLRKLFLASLQKLELVRAFGVDRPFEHMSRPPHRPWAAVVPWPDDRLTEQDERLSKELATHLIGAFFGRTAMPSTDS